MEKKKKLRLNIGAAGRFNFVKAILIFMMLSFLLNCYISYLLFSDSFSLTIADIVPYTAFQLNYAALTMILIITIVWILHYGFGALARMEKILDNIASGDYSQRLRLRQRDLMRPFAEKINKVFDQLEECKGKK